MNTCIRLVLSMSDIIVTQREPVADPTLGGASSAFSRYALIYGLKPGTHTYLHTFLLIYIYVYVFMFM
jgi:hypothetical protein